MPLTDTQLEADSPSEAVPLTEGLAVPPPPPARASVTEERGEPVAALDIVMEENGEIDGVG